MVLHNRRTFLATSGAMLGAAIGGLAAHAPKNAFGQSAAKNAGAAQLPESKVNSQTSSLPNGTGLPTGWRGFRKLDAHNHVMQAIQSPGADWTPVYNLIEAAEFLGIEKLYCSRPLTGGVMAEIDAVRAANDTILAAMQRFPDKIEGFCFIQPGNGPAALDEIERCLDAGMVGVKLYNQFKYNHPAVFPIAERCIQHQIPLLGHSAYLTDPKTLAAQPQTSNSLEFGLLSKRYPELILILGHINGGGDWEWAIKGLKDSPNVYVDTSGSVQEDDAIGRCVRELGHKRVLFATDLSMEGGVGKILSADLTEQQRDDIFYGNFQAILERRRK